MLVVEDHGELVAECWLGVLVPSALNSKSAGSVKANMSMLITATIST